jgi:hypothetical protein
VFSEIFSEFTLGKVWDLNSERLFALVKGKNEKPGGGKIKIRKVYLLKFLVGGRLDRENLAQL